MSKWNYLTFEVSGHRELRKDIANLLNIQNLVEESVREFVGEDVTDKRLNEMLNNADIKIETGDYKADGYVTVEWRVSYPKYWIAGGND